MKKNKTSNRQRAGYKRLDLRNGGRVSFREGDEVSDPNPREVQAEQDRIIRQQQLDAQRNLTMNMDSGGKPFDGATTTLSGGANPSNVSSSQFGNTTAGIDPRAVAADPAGYQKWLEGAKAQEAAVPGSTSLSDQQFGPPETTAPAPPPPPQPFDPGFGNVQPGEYSDEEKPDATGAMKRPTPISMEDPATKSAFDIGREYRILRTGAEAEEMSRGKIPDTIPKIDAPKPLEETEKTVFVSPEEAKIKKFTEQDKAKAGEAILNAEDAEAVSIIENVATSAEPTEFNAAKIASSDLAKVPENLIVEAAGGNVSPEVSQKLAEAAGVQATSSIDSATINIREGALQERVIGTMSTTALASAAKVAGTSLPRITRAKKQLRKAGLTEAEINNLGSDPEDFEAKLTEFTEKQRGLVAGLPEQALVSNQINTLLSGIEEGEIPIWASPAVAAVEQMLAQRGLEASSIGRDSLLNAIITSAVPIAQANAQALQASINQERTIEANAFLKDAEMSQQTALFNAQNVFQLDMAQFSADQQRAINNSKFLQTASIADADHKQQAVVQDAVLMAQRNLAEADQNTKLGIEHARSFLQMDLSNLNNQQQSNVLTAQLNQQSMLSNQSAVNASLQFNATNEQQTNQFMTSLKSQVDQFNNSQINASKQFNATAKNAAEARRLQSIGENRRLNAQLTTQVSQFNSAQNFAREQFNSKNSLLIAQSNVEWRRKINTANTAAINAVNQQNTQNAYGLTLAANNFLWQELRDEADFAFKRWDNDEQRKTSLLVAALGNEEGVDKSGNWAGNLQGITTLVDGFLGDG